MQMESHARLQNMPQPPRQKTTQTRRTILKIITEITLATKTAQKPIDKAATWFKRRIKK
jgi:hypothetical protein